MAEGHIEIDAAVKHYQRYPAQVAFVEARTLAANRTD